MGNQLQDRASPMAIYGAWHAHACIAFVNFARDRGQSQIYWEAPPFLVCLGGAAMAMVGHRHATALALLPTKGKETGGRGCVGPSLALVSMHQNGIESSTDPLSSLAFKCSIPPPFFPHRVC